MLIKFRARHKATKGNKSKTIIQKIIYVITNIIKFITDKLIALAQHTPMGKAGRAYDNDKRDARRSLSFEKYMAEKNIESAHYSNARRKEGVDRKIGMMSRTDYLKKVNEKNS